MPDFSQGVPIVEQTPSPGLLTPKNYTDVSIRGFGDGVWGNILSPMLGSDTVPIMSSDVFASGTNFGYEQLKKAETNRVYSDLNAFLSANEGGGQDVTTMLGLSFEPKQAMVWRQLMNREPLSPATWGDSELTPEHIAADTKLLNELVSKETETTPLIDIPTDRLTPEQQQIRELTNKLAYAKARQAANKNLGFSWWDWFGATNTLGGSVNGLLDSFGLINEDNAKGNADIKAVLTRIDPNFKPADWFTSFAADPVVRQALLEHGIDSDFIANSPNATHAEFRIKQAMITSDVQRRLASYKPTNFDWVKNTGAGLVDFMVDTPTGATLLSLGAAGAVAEFMLPEIGASEAVASSRLLSVGKGVAQSVYRLPIGLVPEWMEGATLLSRVPGYGAALGTAGAINSYARQANEIAFGAATMYANPNVRLDIDRSAIAYDALHSGIEGGLVFGLGLGVLGSFGGAMLNRFKGVKFDSESGFRNPLDKRFTFENTVLGNTIDLFRKKADLSVIGPHPIEAVRTEAVLSGTEPTPERLAAEATGHAERVEAREALRSEEHAEGSPEDVGTRRYVGESLEDYTKRVAPIRGITNIVELATEVGRRDVTQTGSARLTEAQSFPELSVQDQIRTLVRTQKVIEEARAAEEASVGLPVERQRVYETLEKQRKSWIQNLQKRLTPDERKLLKAELSEERKTTAALPALLAASKDASKPIAERRAAASEAAAQILEAAREQAKNPTKVSVKRIAVPKELTNAIDAMVTENALTGTISEKTADTVRKSIMNPEEIQLDETLHTRLQRALQANRIDPDRIAKIREIKADYTQFLELVTGDRQTAKNFYNYVNKLVKDNLLDADGRVLLLASVVHMNFDLHGLKLKYKTVDRLDVEFEGQYDPGNKTLTFNKAYFASPENTIRVFLHELGHALFAEHMSGKAYLKQVQLFNRARDFSNNPKISDSVFENQWFYHAQNLEETFVEMLSTILTQEAKTVISPLKGQVVRGVLNSMIDRLMQTVHALEDSSYYEYARGLVNDLVTLDTEIANKTVSVSNFVSSLTLAKNSVINEGFTLVEANKVLQDRLLERNPNLTQLPELTQGEYEMLFTKTDNHIGSIAYAISYEHGKHLINSDGTVSPHINKFINAYREYRNAMLNNVIIRTSQMLMNKPFISFLATLDSKTRKQKIWEALSLYTRDTEPFKGALPLTASYQDFPASALRNNSYYYMKDTFQPFTDILYERILNAPDVSKNANTLTVLELSKLIQRIESDYVLTTDLYTELNHRYNTVTQQEWIKSFGHPPLENSYNTVLKKSGLMASQLENRFSVPRPEGLPDLAALFNVKDRESTMIAIETLLEDKKSLGLFDPMYVLTNILKVDENAATAILKGSEKLKNNAAKSIWGLNKLHNALKKKSVKMLEWDGESWIIPVDTVSKPPVETPMPSAEAIASAEAGSRFVRPEQLDSVIETFAQKMLDRNLGLDKKSNVSMNKVQGIGDKLVDFLDPESSERAALIAWMTKEPRTESQVHAYIRKSGNREGTKTSKTSSIDAGEEQTQSAKVSDENKIVPTVKLKERDVKSEAFVIMKQLHEAAEKASGQGIFTEKQLADLNDIIEDRVVTLADGKEEKAPVTMSSLAEKWGLSSKAGASMRVKRLEATFAKILGLDPNELNRLLKTDITRKEFAMLKNKLEDWQEKINEVAKEKATPIEPLETKIPEPAEAAEAASKLMETLEIETKMDVEGEAVLVPTSEASSGHAIVETPTVKPEDTTPLVHTNKVADALINEEPVAEKIAVKVETKKSLTLPGKFTSTNQVYARLWQILTDAYPEETSKIGIDGQREYITTKLLEQGYDSIIDERGTVVPLKEPKKVGKYRRDIKTEPVTPTPTEEVKTEVVPSTENGVPTITDKKVVRPKKGPVGTVVVKDPKGTEAVAPVVKTKSEVADVPEAEKLERKVNEDEKLLRSNGMDRDFLRRFIKRYWSSKFEAAGKGTLTPQFKAAWEKFVLVNEYIAEANRRVFGDDVMERFWAKVDEIHAKEVLRVKAAEDPLAVKPLTRRQVLAKAAEAMRQEGKPDFVAPILPEDVSFVKADASGAVRLTSKNKTVRAILETADRDALKVEPPPVSTGVENIPETIDVDGPASEKLEWVRITEPGRSGFGMVEDQPMIVYELRKKGGDKLSPVLGRFTFIWDSDNQAFRPLAHFGININERYQRLGLYGKLLKALSEHVDLGSTSTLEALGTKINAGKVWEKLGATKEKLAGKRKDFIDLPENTEAYFLREGSKKKTAKDSSTNKTNEKTVEPPTEKGKVIEAAINNAEGGASRLLRLNNLIGFIFGGDNSARATWWRKQMAKLANVTQGGSQLGNTIRSINNRIAFIARWADDTRAQTGHLVAAGTRPFKTMLQCKMDEGTMVTRILRAYSEFNNLLGKSADRAAIHKYMYECLRKGETPQAAELLRLGANRLNITKALKQGNYLLDVTRAVNERVLYMENATGRLMTLNRDGTPVDPTKYAPVQFDHEALSRLNPGDYTKIVEAMARVRRNSKLNDNKLDINTMIVMGWVGVEFNPETGGFNFYSKARVLKQAEGVNMFSKDTLLKLRVDADGTLLPEIDTTGVTGDKNTLLNKLRQAAPDKYFILQSDNKFTMYRLPETIADLSDTDRQRYREAVNGNTAMYTPEWREKLRGKDLIFREMEELYAYKVKDFPYNKGVHSLERPMFKIDDNNKSGITVAGLTPEEAMSDSMLADTIRTNLAEAYFHWLRGRYFDLAFQMELDRVMGTSGITWLDVLKHTGEETSKDIKTLARENLWTSKQLEEALLDVRNGINRLEEEFRHSAETLPHLHDAETLGLRAATAAVRFKLSAGYGISQFTEILHELAKEAPEFWRIPANVWTAIRYVLGDYRFSKNRMLMGELGDMTFVLESMKTDLSNRFLGEAGRGTLSLDSPVATGWAKAKQRLTDASGVREKSVAFLEGAGDAMQALGSLGAQTQAVRVLAKARLQREIWHYIKNGSLERLITALQDPGIAAELAELKKAAANNQAIQPKLWKRFADIARKNGFGFDQHDALMFLKYGLTDLESIRTLKWAFEKAGHSNGRINMHSLYDIVDYLRRNPEAGINPDVLERVLSNYKFMLEDRIIKEATSELRGLNKQTDLASRTTLGRMWFALTSFVRSYQDNVLMGYASKNTVKYLAAGLFLYTIIDTMVGLFKEYLAGRKMDDIVKEISDNPSSFFIRGIARVPYLGMYNGYLEAAMAGASALNGGTYKYYGTPGLPSGASAGISAISGMYRNAVDTVNPNSDVAERIKGASGLLGFTEVVNRSGMAIPIRSLEDAGAVERKSAIGTYLDLVHRNPYPYSKLANQQPGVGSFGLLESSRAPEYSTMQRAATLDAMQKQAQLQQYVAAMPKPRTAKRGSSTNPFDSTSPNSGVSSPLADLLDND